jgi:hypothetical protein
MSAHHRQRSGGQVVQPGGEVAELDVGRARDVPGDELGIQSDVEQPMAGDAAWFD